MRDHLVRLLVIALLAAGVAWVVSVTEWAEIEVSTPARGEAAENDFYATQQMVRQLGARVERPQTLERMPGPEATLLLTSSQWKLFPERAQRLRDWVEAGGHLVIPVYMLDDELLAAWLPVRTEDEDDEDDEDDDEDEEDADEDTVGPDVVSPEEEADPDDALMGDPADAEADAPGASDGDGDGNDDRPALQARAAGPAVMALQRKPGKDCHEAVEPEGVRPFYRSGGRAFEVCAYGGDALTTPRTPLWALHGPEGPEVLRVAVGRGSVTVVSPWDIFFNHQFFKGDNALLTTAALQVRPGADIWFVAEEARPSFLAWLWDTAWVAVLLGLFAIGLALWRGGVRFGPLAAVAVPVRRSMREQITGTAQFLRAEGTQTLCQAQRRALEDMARTHLRDFARLGLSERAQAIARATGLDAPALGQALDPRRPLSRGETIRTLELLETARRLLRERSRERARGRPAPPPVR